MNEEKVVEILMLAFADSTVSYAGKVYPTGAVACMTMNMGSKIVEEMLPLCRKIAPLNTLIRTGGADKVTMIKAGEAAKELLRMLSDYEPFAWMKDPDVNVALDQAFSMEAYKKIHAYYNVLLSGGLDDEARKRFQPTMNLINLTPALANLSDGMQLLQERIAAFAEKLDAKDLPRTKEVYLEQFEKYFPESFRFGDNGDAWLAMLNVTVQYTAGFAENGRRQMRKHMHYTGFGGMLRSDFFEGLSVGHAPKRCGICGRWFLTTDARRTKYCNGICPTDLLGRKCRVIGNMQGREARELAEDHPLNVPYDRRMNTIDQCVKRGTLTPELAAAMKKLAKDKKQRAKADMEYAIGTYMEEMEQDALKAEALRMID